MTMEGKEFENISMEELLALYKNWTVTNPSKDSIMHTDIWMQSATYGIILIIWSIVFNSMVIFLCLYSRITRHDSFYIQVVNMSASNMMLSILVTTFVVYYDLYYWSLGDLFCKIWIVMDILLPFVTTCIICQMNLDKVVQLFRYRISNMPFKCCMIPAIVLTPWLSSITAVVPIWIEEAVTMPTPTGQCVISLSTFGAITTAIITYFIPLLIIITLTLAILINSMKARDDNVRNGHILTTSNVNTPSTFTSYTDSGRFPSSTSKVGGIAPLCIVNFLFFALWFPYHCIGLVLPLCSELCVTDPFVINVVAWLGSSTVGVTPLVWLMDSALKRNFKKCIFRIFRQGSRHAYSMAENTTL
ncbi:hypothetical protein CHS0354_027606 [Potamilus streckersoni]|uniref:G-protein coupled receptors family 1 profile domain-containing protein n=1 Tax=Potamilus streckersoni TaxID=2493646 RepID=A0AAE0S4D9_9BIVA|nr:hypothetical protein CHS0354_027606 [Potamilus streckersoni]